MMEREMTGQTVLPDAVLPPKRPAALVVDDSRTGRRIAEALLQVLGFDVVCAASIADALEAIEARCFALFTIDRNLDGEDGVDLVRQLRVSRFCGERPRILAMTGHVGEEHSEAFFTAGADAYLCKPFTVRDLAAVLDALGFPVAGSRDSNAAA